jgi:hypothetical protein
MTNVAIQDVTAASSASADSLLGVKGGVAKLFNVGTLALNWVATIGTSPVARSLQLKIQDTMGVSILDYGADSTGVADSATAINRAIGSGARRVHAPQGTYRCNSTITMNQSLLFYGDGRNFTTINSYVSAGNHGMVLIGDSSLGGANLLRLEGFKFHYSGTGQTAASGSNNNWSGIYVQRKAMMNEVWVDNFTNDGFFFAPSDASEGATSTLGTIGNAVFFSVWTNVWSKHNGRDGIRVRMGANANTFINCDWSNNTGVGFHHLTDGGATYGNVVISGQASYNSSYGYYLESGTNLTTFGLYAELNGSPDNTSANGYTGSTIVDFYVGDNLSRSKIHIGTVFNSTNTHVRAPSSGLNDSICVETGGDRIFTTTASHLPHRVSTVLTSSSTTAAIVSVLQAAGVCN